MVSATLLADSLLAVGLAALYLSVGSFVGRRHTSSADAGEALSAFVTWWRALAVLTALGAVRTLLAGLGVLDVGLHRGLTYLSLFPLAVALWGLVTYLAYVQTGDRRWFRPLRLAYVALAAYLVLLTAWRHPIGVRAGGWSVVVEYEHALEGALQASTLALVLGPVLVAAIGYFSLLFRVRDAISRYRIGMVSGAVILWFGSALLAAAAGWNQWYWWPLTARAVGLVATMIIVLAYKPPRALGATLDRRRAGGDPHAAPPQPSPRRLAHAAPSARAEGRSW